MPNITPPRPLPRPIRRPGAAVPVVPTEPAAPEIVESSGLRCIRIESPRAADREWLEEHFEFHPLDFEDI